MKKVDKNKKQVLLRKRTYDGCTEKWGPWVDVYTRPEPSKNVQTSPFVYNFPRGEGQLCIYANLLASETQKAISKDILQCRYARQYEIQNSPEPRAHFLLHEEATAKFSMEQPGYRYGSVCMKSRPLSVMPRIDELSTYVENVCRRQGHEAAGGGSFWNVGVNVVIYRCGRDKMGLHADNDQGETLILTVLVCSPVGATRKINIRSFNYSKLNHKDKDEEFRLCLDAGDAYSMNGKYPSNTFCMFMIGWSMFNVSSITHTYFLPLAIGTMQKHYKHGVPCDNKCVGRDVASNANADKRIAIVFRRGRFAYQSKDNGNPIKSLKPRVYVPHIFGNCIKGLKEGSTYTRKELVTYSYHRYVTFGYGSDQSHIDSHVALLSHLNRRTQQKGVSGTGDKGCDAIIVSGARDDGLGEDNLFTLMYAASMKEGAKSILTSKEKEIPIRVFRSTELDTVLKAVRQRGETTTPKYRYDGLYHVSGYTKQMHAAGTHLVYLFYLSRVENGVGAMKNRVKSEEFIGTCVRQGSMLNKALRNRFSQTTTWPPLVQRQWASCKMEKIDVAQGGEERSLQRRRRMEEVDVAQDGEERSTKRRRKIEKVDAAQFGEERSTKITRRMEKVDVAQPGEERSTKGTTVQQQQKKRTSKFKNSQPAMRPLKRNDKVEEDCLPVERRKRKSKEECCVTEIANNEIVAKVPRKCISVGSEKTSLIHNIPVPVRRENRSHSSYRPRHSSGMPSNNWYSKYRTSSTLCKSQ